MKQNVDVIAIFEAGKRQPRPLKFKLIESSEKITVNVDQIKRVEEVGAGFVKRFEYDCESAGLRGAIKYKLSYLYNDCKWIIETK